MIKIKTLSTLIALTLPLCSFAASMIESRDAQGNLTQIYLQGNKARIEMPDNQGFAIMDVQNKTMQVVMHRQRIVMDMSNYMKDQTSGSSQAGGAYIDSYLKSGGLGPKIAGYETEEQEVYADGQYCGSVFVSVRAMNELDLRRFARALESMSEKIQKNISAMTGMKMNQLMDPCTQAEKSLLDQLVNTGFPLKSIDGNRRTESVVTRLLRNSPLPANAFVIPQHYQLTHPAKMMRDAMQKMQSPQPNMQQMMNNLPPEAQQIMRERMRQMQQQYQR